LPETVSERDFEACLVKLRDLRLWGVQNNIDPWAFRQMLLIALEMDTRAALDRGISLIDLQKFDSIAKKDIQLWMQKLPSI